MKYLLACWFLFSLGGAVLCESITESTCEDFFSHEICDEHFPVRADEPFGTVDKASLEEMLRQKIDWLVSLGLLKTIPFLGEKIHKVVEENPELVVKLISGKIFFILDRIKKLLNQ